MKIYTTFAELGWFVRIILPIIKNYIQNGNKLKLLSFNSYSKIAESYVHNQNLEVVYLPEEVNINYRRFWHGNPINDKNFSIINTIGYASHTSKLITCNTWLINSNFIQEWIKKENIDFDKLVKECKEPLYNYLIKLYPDKPWEKYVNEKNILYDLDNDLFKWNSNEKHFRRHCIKYKIIKINPKLNNYIHIFPKNKGRSDNQFININIYKNICIMIKNEFPTLEICCHGHIESFQKELINNNLIKHSTNSLEKSINILNNSKLLISPGSGFAEMALSCGIKNIIYLLISDPFNFNPFKAKISSIYISSDYLSKIEKLIKRIYF